MKRLIAGSVLIISIIYAAATSGQAGLLNSKQIDTRGTPTAVSTASAASNGTASGMARVDHSHALAGCVSSNQIYEWNGSAWVCVNIPGGGGGVSPPLCPAGQVLTNDDASYRCVAETDPSVNALGKATLSPVNSQVPVWNGDAGTWVTGTAAITEVDPTVNSLGKTIFTPSNGQVPGWNGDAGVWVANTITVNSSIIPWTGTDAGVSYTGLIESTFTGFKFPDTTTMATAVPAGGTNNYIPIWNSSTSKWVPGVNTGASQWTTTGSDIYYNTGKVGIGRTPTYQLDVYDAADANVYGWVQSSSTTKGAFLAAANSGSTSTLGLAAYGSAYGAVPTRANWAALELNSSVLNLVRGISNVPLTFLTNDTEQMRIAADGKVGIGSAAPDYKLTISGEGSYVNSTFSVDNYSTTENNNMLFRRARGTKASPANVVDGDYIGSFQANAWNGGGWKASAGIDFIVSGAVSGIGRAPGAVVFNTAPANGSFTERMRIDPAGQVGIGRSPTSNLDVYEPTDAYGNIQMTISSSTKAAGFYAFNDGAASYAGIIAFGTAAAGSVLGVSRASAAGFNLAGAATNFFRGLTNVPMLFGTNDTERMRIAADGKVGIGMTPSTEILEVNGNVKPTGYKSSDGTAGASQSVTVKGSAGANCDLVFKNGLFVSTTCP